MALPKDKEKYNYMFSDDMKFVQKAVVFHPSQPQTFLIIRRSLQDRSRAGEWDLPGGNVLFGENHEKSLRREIKEETGLIVGELKPIHINTFLDKNKQIYFLFIKYVTTAESTIVSLSFEHSEYKWVTKKEFAKLDTAGFSPEIAGAFL